MPEKTVRKLGRADVKAYVRKSEQYLEAAEESFEEGRYDAAASAAIHAGISAADAITGGRSGVRSSGPDHAAALGLLERAGPDGIEAAKLLRRLLPLKYLAEYDSAPVTTTRATSGLGAARPLVSIGRRVGASLA